MTDRYKEESYISASLKVMKAREQFKYSWLYEESLTVEIRQWLII